MYGIFEREVWPTIQEMDPLFKLHLLGLRPQSDSTNCGLWVLWAIEIWKKYLNENDATPLQRYLTEYASKDRITDMGHPNDAHMNSNSSVRINEHYILTRKKELRTHHTKDHQPKGPNDVHCPPRA